MSNQPPIQYTNPLGIPFHAYQLFAKQFILTHPYCGLFLDCGLGKTLIVLATLYEINPNGHVLIIAPKNIARSTWIDERDKWNIPIRIKSLLVDEKGKDLKADVRHQMYKDILNEPPTVYLINIEKIPDLIRNLPVNDIGQKIWPFPVVVIDESHSFKSYNSTRFTEMQKVRPCISRLIELTGTPTPKDLQDLWPQIFLLDQGLRLGPNITAYRDAFFKAGKIINNHPVDWKPLPGAEQEIYRRISDIVISMKNTQIQLPDIVYNDIFVYMTEEEKALYKEFVKEKVIDVCVNTDNNTEDNDGNDSTNTNNPDEKEENTISITAANAGVLSLRLSQMASGAIYTDDKHNYALIHEHKAEHCKYIIENTDSPVIIAYHFKSDADIIINYFKKQKNSNITPVIFDGSPEMKKDWNDGKIPVMLLQPASNGKGLNLQYGGHTLIWYTIPWSLEEYIQTTARLYRQGQNHTVIIHHLLTHETIDLKILDAIHHKDVSQNNLLEAVRVTVDDAINKI